MWCFQRENKILKPKIVGYSNTSAIIVCVIVIGIIIASGVLYLGYRVRELQEEIEQFEEVQEKVVEGFNVFVKENQSFKSMFFKDDVFAPEDEENEGAEEGE